METWCNITSLQIQFLANMINIIAFIVTIINGVMTLIALCFEHMTAAIVSLTVRAEPEYGGNTFWHQ